MDIQARLQILTERRQQHVDAHNRALADVQTHDGIIKHLSGAIEVLQEQLNEAAAETAVEGDVLPPAE